MSTVYLNGAYVAKHEAKVSVDDRGFLFADGVYEATPAYRGRCFLLDRHLRRLARGLAALSIDFDAEELAPVHPELLRVNDLEEEPLAFIYVQVTRGAAASRGHAFPEPPVAPTVYAFAAAVAQASEAQWEKGFGAVTVPDCRWARVDVKTISLVANVLAQQAAAEADVADAIFVRDGMVMEGAHNNVFAVIDGALVTAPATNYILHGITRGFVLELARELGLTVEERALPLEELYRADEVFFTGTTTEVRPTVTVDGRTIGDGRPGPLTRRLREVYLERARLGSN